MITWDLWLAHDNCDASSPDFSQMRKNHGGEQMIVSMKSVS
jgi:hypothetical protein